MKRFLILSIVIVFLTVSCAGPNKVKYRIPDYLQNDFENDRKECSDSIDKNLNSEAFGKALEECLEKKGYQFTEKPPLENNVLVWAGAITLIIALSPLILAYGVLRVGSAP